VLALAAVSCCACFESTTILRVRSDGSGTLQQRTIVKQAALAQLRTFAALGGGRATLDPLSEDQARQLATSLGAGVTYVSSAMLAGAHLLLAMEPQGRLVRTSSPYVDGQRVTLLEVDLDRVLGDEAFLDRLRAAKTLDEVRAVTKDAPGLKINLDPEITVEFTGQPPPAAVAWRIRASQRLKAVTR